jgi:hypothetical protein
MTLILKIKGSGIYLQPLLNHWIAAVWPPGQKRLLLKVFEYKIDRVRNAVG